MSDEVKFNKLDMNGRWVHSTLQAATQMMNALGVLTQSKLTVGLASAMGSIMQGEYDQVEISCPHCQNLSLKYPVWCVGCGKDLLQHGLYPGKVIVKFDQTNPTSPTFGISFYSVMFVLKQMGYEDTTDKAEELLDSLTDEASLEQFIKLIGLDSEKEKAN